jgi:hypothetical protein
VSHSIIPNFKKRLTISHAKILVSPLSPLQSSISLSYDPLPMRISLLVIRGSAEFKYWLISGFVSYDSTIHHSILGHEFPYIPIIESDDYYIIMIHSLYSPRSVEFTRKIVSASWSRKTDLIGSLDCRKVTICGIDLPLETKYAIVSNDGDSETVEVTEDLRQNIWVRFMLLWFFIAVSIISFVIVAIISAFYAILGLIVGPGDDIVRDEREEEREYRYMYIFIVTCIVGGESTGMKLCRCMNPWMREMRGYPGMKGVMDRLATRVKRALTDFSLFPLLDSLVWYAFSYFFTVPLSSPSNPKPRVKVFLHSLSSKI